jgi:hypothetical protein
MKLVRKFDVLTIQFNILFKAVHIPGIKKHCSRSSFSFADSEVQRRISIDGSTSNSELSGHSATLKQIQNVATNLIHGSLEKSSKDSYRRVFAFYKEFMLLYFPQEMVFPASLENLTLFIAYCFQKKLASSTVLTSAISFLLQLGGYEDLPGHFIISKALRGYHKEKAAKDSRLPITPSILKDLC